MAAGLRVTTLVLAASLCGCSSTTAGGTGGVGGDAGSGGSVGSGGVGGNSCALPLSDYCSPESCPTAEDELMTLESLIESEVPHANAEFAFCDGRLASVHLWPGCYVWCGQCDVDARYYGPSGALIGVQYVTDSDVADPCPNWYTMTWGSTDPQCEGVVTYEGPCFGVPCAECDFDNGEVCEDGNECTADSCCPGLGMGTTGYCDRDPLSDGTPCKGGECIGGACTPIGGMGGNGGSAGHGGGGGA